MGSLRAAINAANADPGSTIAFAIPGAGPHTIAPLSALPTITQSVTIDGYGGAASANTLDTGDNAVLTIEILGGDISGAADGLTIDASNCIVQGLVIDAFGGNAINIDGGNNNAIRGNFIGTNPTGTAAPFPNQGEGISIYHGAKGNIIGGTLDWMRNVISGNKQDGIGIFDSGTIGNQILGNFIGTNAAGTAPLGNGTGVHITNAASDNDIGAPTATGFNVISGNGNGIVIAGPGVSHNLVLHNGIGTDATGTTAVPNSYGVVIGAGATDNTVGIYISDNVDSGRNLISGNAVDGITILDSGTSGNVVQGNLIGLDISGHAPLANLNGVRIVNGASGNTIGGIAGVGGAYFGNFISGNTQVGVIISGSHTTGNLVQTNWIGPDFFGGNSSPNGLQGVLLQHGASNNVIGGTIAFDSMAVPAGNVISNNTVSGVRLSDLGTSSNTVAGNKIGTDVAGNAALPNGAGIEIQNNAASNIIGGTVTGAGNVVSGNTHTGIDIGVAYYNVIEGNKVGTNAAGDSALGNATGVYLHDGSTLVTVGGTLPGSGNVISANLGAGIQVDGPDTSLDLIEGNYIGTDAAGIASHDAQGHHFGNQYGVMIEAGATDIVLGGTDPGAGNVVANSSVTGIVISDAGTSYNQVEGNKIGTDLSGTVSLGNRLNGVVIYSGAANNTIGGLLSGAGNTIAFNGEEGIRVGSSSAETTTVGNAILGNSIFSNGELVAGLPVLPVGFGIAVVGANDIHNAPGPHTGPNHLQNYPVLVSAVGQADGTVVVQGLLNSTPNTNYRIEVFASPEADKSGFGQGQTFLGASGVTTDSTGNASFALTVGSLPVGTYISSTATDLTTNVNDTSEFSQDIQVRSAPAPVISSLRDPDHAADPTTGSEGPFDLVVDGSNFASDAAALLNGALLSTRFISSTRLEAQVPASLGEEGTDVITVSNPGLYGAVSQPMSLLVLDGNLTFAGRAQSETAGTPFTDYLAVLTDSGGPESADSYSVTIDWGDHSKSTGQVATSGLFTFVQGTHTYAREGSYSVGVAVLDEGGSFVTGYTTITVADAPLTGVSKSLAFVEGLAASRVAASFKDADPSGSVGDYTTTINWGDGSTSPGVVSANGDGFDVTGSHAYARAGSYPVTVSITDAGGASLSVGSSASVGLQQLSAQGVSFAVTGKKNFSGIVATFTDPDPRIDPTFYSATISWGDGSPVTAGVVSGRSSPFTVSGSHTYPSFTSTDILTITISDKLGRTVVVNSRVVDPPAAQVNETWISQVFQDLLGRPAEQSALDFWSGLLDHGVDRSQIVQAIEQSPEFRALEIEQVYTQFLERSADSAGLSYFTSELLSGMTLEQVQAQIVGSAEFFQNAGGTTSGFLDALYQQGLGRPVDSGGQEVWSTSLANGVTREQVAAAVFSSDEYQQAVVQGAYQHYLHRAADEAGLAFFSVALRKGTPNDAMIASLAGSDEYWNSLNFAAGA
jgi:hypothetical protein